MPGKKNMLILRESPNCLFQESLYRVLEIEDNDFATFR
jgi:hypothetical protein